jgi:hypothetical protein
MIVHAGRPRVAGAGLPADRFLQHKRLILVAVGGAVAETGLLALVAPGAQPMAPQVTALPVLGNGTVLPMVSAFLAGSPVTGQGEGRLRNAAELISSAAAAWRMPVAHPVCP